MRFAGGPAASQSQLAEATQECVAPGQPVAASKAKRAADAPSSAAASQSSGASRGPKPENRVAHPAAPATPSGPI